jgi:putative membrane protein
VAGENELQAGGAIRDRRVDWALERTRLAKERTFAAWMRTSLAAIGLAVALVKLVPDSDEAWLISALALLFLFVGAVVCVFAVRRFADVVRKLEAEGHPPVPMMLPRILALTLLVAALIGLAVVLVD